MHSTSLSTLLDDTSGYMLLATGATAPAPYASAPFVSDGAEGVILTLTVTPEESVQAAEVGVRFRLAPRFVGDDPAKVRLLKHNYQSWGATYSLSLADADFRADDPVNRSWTRATPARVPPGEIESDGFLLLRGGAGQHLLVGFLTALRFFGTVVIRQDGDSVILDAYQQTEGVSIAAGSTFRAEPLIVLSGNDPWRLLECYAEEVARRMGARVPHTAPIGWNPYYFYYCEDTAEDFAANADRLAGLRDTLPAALLSTDEGPSPNRGDWFLPSTRYPGGVSWAIDQAHARGFAAGVWWTPFCASAQWDALQQHPDWVLRDAHGAPVSIGITDQAGVPFVALDATHPGVLDFIRDTTARYVAEGVKLLKLDFCYAGALAGVRHDPTATRVTALRQGLQVIRDVCGDDVCLLGCGMPVMPSIGLVDINRIGQDFKPYWDAPNGDRNLFGRDNPHRNIITRGFTHRRWYLNDPDCLAIRQDSTELTEAESFASLHLVGMSGGPIFYSDNLVTLAAERLAWYRFVSPAVTWRRGPIPLDLLDREVPSVMLAEADGYYVALLYNDTREEREITLSLAGQVPDGTYLLFEPHAGEVVASLAAHETITLPVPAHSVRFFRITPDMGRPMVVGDTLHISQGSTLNQTECYTGDTLQITLRTDSRRSGALFIYDPTIHRVVPLAVDGVGEMHLQYPEVVQ